MVIPMYSVDDEHDMVLRICPECYSRNTYKLIHFQDVNGDREDNYIVGCANCDFNAVFTDVACSCDLSKSTLRKIARKRRENACKKGFYGEFQNVKFDTTILK